MASDCGGVIDRLILRRFEVHLAENVRRLERGHLAAEHLVERPVSISLEALGCHDAVAMIAVETLHLDGERQLATSLLRRRGRAGTELDANAESLERDEATDES